MHHSFVLTSAEYLMQNFSLFKDMNMILAKNEKSMQDMSVECHSIHRTGTYTQLHFQRNTSIFDHILVFNQWILLKKMIMYK